MNKKVLYGIIIVIGILVFTIVWENSKKDDMKGEIGEQNTPTETTTVTPPANSAATISDDVNKIEVDSGIDADLKAIDTDLGTL